MHNMLNFVHYTNVFGYSMSIAFAVLFLCQFLVYNCTKILITHNSFYMIAVNIHATGVYVNMFIRD